MGSVSKTAVHLIIHGHVQGVGFRYFTQAEARKLGLAGWVRNLPDETVEAYAEGARTALEAWMKRLGEGPPLSRVDGIRAAWMSPEESSSAFFIR